MSELANKLYIFFNNDKYKLGLFFILIFLSVFSICVIQPNIEGDSASYVESIEVLKTGNASEGFTPYRIITTFFGLKSIMLVDVFFNNIKISWMVLNSILYIFMGMFFYSLCTKIFENHRVAFISTLFLVTNYAAVVFSFHYLMDVGGWAFYITSLYFSYLYLENKNKKWLWVASVLVGVGGLFKEYAYLAYIVIFGLIIHLNLKNWREIIKLSFVSGLLAFSPMVAVNIYSFITYHYTYLSWYLEQNAYNYQNKIVEYIKSFGSLYNFGWFIFLPGLYIYLKKYKEIFKDQKLFFIFLVALSSCVVFVWPVVTRVLFITVPALVLISMFYIKKIESKWYLLIPLIIAYTISSYLMDSYILNIVNLGI